MDDPFDFASPAGLELAATAAPKKTQRWTAQQKARIVSETLQPGAKVCDVAQRHGANASRVSTWRTQALAGELPLSAADAAVAASSAPKNRGYTAQQKARIVSETFQPGVTVRDVAQRHGVRAKLVSNWRTQARAGKLALFDPQDSPDFVPLVVESVPPKLCPADAGGQLDVVVGEVTVRLDNSIDVARLAQIVRALNGCAA